MDIFVLLGFLLANVLVLFGMVFDNDKLTFVFSNVTRFINYPSIAITVGGTFATLMISYPARNFMKIIDHMKMIFFPPKYDIQKNIEQILEFAQEARAKGLLSLEDKLNQSDDPFLKNGMMLVVDSVEPEKVKYIMETQLESLEQRHSIARSFYEKGAAFAPAFGMIGTLVGLVLMLAQLDDPSTIGPSMATALLTTLYGSMLANMFFMPVASKLKFIHEEEFLYKTISMIGIEAIQAGENPKFISEKLNQLLANSERDGENKKEKKGKKEK